MPSRCTIAGPHDHLMDERICVPLDPEAYDMAEEIQSLLEHVDEQLATTCPGCLGMGDHVHHGKAEPGFTGYPRRR